MTRTCERVTQYGSVLVATNTKQFVYCIKIINFTLLQLLFKEQITFEAI